MGKLLRQIFGGKATRKQPPRFSNAVLAETDVRHVHLLDTGVGSDNVGDEIIMEKCRLILEPYMQDSYVTSSSSHDGLGPWSRSLIETADLVILLGTNALAPFDQRTRQHVWTIRDEDLELLSGKVVLFGVGANRYFDEIDAAQKALLHQILATDFTHSVRDNLGAEIVRACGHKAINTSCPTLWGFADVRQDLPKERAATVCFTLTAHKATEDDVEMVEILRAVYERVAFWPQQPRDLAYLRSMPNGSDGIEILAPNLSAYDTFLTSERPDVVGTRLHGSIRGLHNNCRALAVAIDNRADQIGSETGLPTLKREWVKTDLERVVKSDFAALPNVPKDAIRTFLMQFE